MANNRNLNGEILTLETAEKLARIDNVLKYINDTLKKAYLDYRLSGDAVIQLQTIENMLRTGKCIKEVNLTRTK